MSLNRNGLSAALLAMMDNAEKDAWTKQQVADAMAAAIDGYVRAGAVQGVVVTLPDSTRLTQTNSVGLS